MMPYLATSRQIELRGVQNLFYILLKAAPTNLRAYCDSWTFFSTAETFSSRDATLILRWSSALQQTRAPG